ncbi:unnamed protein product [Schistosoma turkestanicum]|nr:unnamed protein product [Schistosoma turkestanicum]
MELFDLSVDDAISESVQTLTLEGVDLSDIVKDMIKYENGHPCAIAIKNLEGFLETDRDSSKVSEALQSLQLPRNSDNAVRKMLIDMNSVDILLNLFDLYTPVQDYGLCTSLLNVLSRIIKGHSDSIRENHIQKLVDLLLKLIGEFNENTSTDSEFNLIAAIYSVLHLSCTKNEKNRTYISQTQTVTQTINFFMRITELFENLPFNAFYPTIKEGCGFLRPLTIDDDLDAEFGLGSENARTIAKTDSCLEVFVKLISKILNSTNVNGISDLFQTLSTIITREELCIKFASLNGIDILMQTIYSNIKSAVIVSSALMLLQAVCGSDACKLSVSNWSMHNISGPQLIVDMFEEHIKSPVVTKYISGTRFFLIKTLEFHLSNASTVRATCRAIRNCVSRSPELRSSFLTSECGSDSGLEKLLNSALKIPSCCDEAKAALRDLNCKVELREFWKGPLQTGLISSG